MAGRTEPVQSPAQALEQILTAAGIGLAADCPVAFAGADPVLPTRYLMGTAGAAALAAVGLAAAGIYRLKSGQGQRISVDVGPAALAMRANTLLRIGGKPAADPWDDISGFHQGADGRWIQLHCQFRHFRDGVLKLLGAADNRESVAKAISRWRIPELEDALAALGVPGFILRDHAEWAAHQQGAAVAGLPLIAIERIGDAPTEPLPVGPRPLSGIRVLDLARVIAGPMVGRTLAEHGAHVLRVSGPGLPSIEQLVIDTGHGKRAAEIDLGSADGRATLERLATGADVFSQAYRPDSLAAKGFGPAQLARLRPGIVCVTLSAWGHAGPWAARRGYDTLVQCATGVAHEQGRDGKPQHLPGSALDYLSGYLGAFGAMVALSKRATEGGSWLVRLSLAQTVEWLKALGRANATGDPRELPLPGPSDFGIRLERSETHWGKIEFLGPVLRMSATPPGFERVVRPLGNDDPVWLA
jgi:crotonobetainyl-CoA:carnitine CoA-transferase CaiB-like acyl-CoA transferase